MQVRLNHDYCMVLRLQQPLLGLAIPLLGDVAVKDFNAFPCELLALYGPLKSPNGPSPERGMLSP